MEGYTLRSKRILPLRIQQ